MPTRCMHWEGNGWQEGRFESGRRICHHCLAIYMAINHSGHSGHSGPLCGGLPRPVGIALREFDRLAIRHSESFERRCRIRTRAGYHMLDAKKTDSNSELLGRQLLDAHDLTQVFQIETAECRHNMQTNPWFVRIPFRDEIKPVAAEIPHGANFLEMSTYGIGSPNVDESIDLDARFATTL